MIDETDKKIIRFIQGDLPLIPSPFAEMAESLGLSEHEVVDRIRRLKEKGVLRRFGATLWHQEAGFSSNAMVVWNVPESIIDDVGKKLARFREVTHCYQRKPHGDWKYNLYTMVHGETGEECYRIAERMSRVVRIDDYTLLFSEKELKKTSMKYF